MNGFTPGLLDRLMRAGGQGGAALTAEQLKDLVARDLEALFNTHPAGWRMWRNGPL